MGKLLLQPDLSLETQILGEQDIVRRRFRLTATQATLVNYAYFLCFLRETLIFHFLKQSIILIKNVFENNILRHVDTTRPFHHDNETLEIMLILVVAANTSEAIYDNDLEFASDDTL